ncbi:hypothetical protein Taro_036884 [Colocasia esculenta]|uniref:RNase H type-1 domain-containing protein n=1 Tax=Colocasia esculenta TaxID=4460 RepID=A0A843W2Q1_COLES|nr:hypothetical protein [Colocasia esculenta]
MSVVWEIWCSRNRARFQDQIMSAKHIVNRAMLLVRVAGTFFKLRQLPQQWLKALKQVGDIHGHFKTAKPKVVKWMHPPTGRLKLSVHGAFKNAAGSAGGGGILRDHQGTCLFAFAKKYQGAISALDAEARALQDGLTTCCNKGILDIMVETDSTTLMQIVTGQTPPPWELICIIQEMVVTSKKLEAQIKHMTREANQVANSLAGYGCSINQFRFWDSRAALPHVVKGSYRLDKNRTGVCSRRFTSEPIKEVGLLLSLEKKWDAFLPGKEKKTWWGIQGVVVSLRGTAELAPFPLESSYSLEQSRSLIPSHHTMSSSDFLAEWTTMKRELYDLRRQLDPQKVADIPLPSFQHLRIPPQSEIPIYRKSLDGPALEWFYSLPPEEAEDFQVVQERFLQQFQDRVGPEYSFVDLVAEKMKADEEFSVYADRWRSLAAKVRCPMLEEEKVKLLISNATPTYRAILAMNDITTMHQLYSRAHFIQTQLKDLPIHSMFEAPKSRYLKKPQGPITEGIQTNEQVSAVNNPQGPVGRVPLNQQPQQPWNNR